MIGCMRILSNVSYGQVVRQLQAHAADCRDFVWIHKLFFSVLPFLSRTRMATRLTNCWWLHTQTHTHTHTQSHTYTSMARIATRLTNCWWLPSARLPRTSCGCVHGGVFVMVCVCVRVCMVCVCERECVSVGVGMCACIGRRGHLCRWAWVCVSVGVGMCVCGRVGGWAGGCVGVPAGRW